MVYFLSVPFVGGADQKEVAQMQRPFLVAMCYGIAIVTSVCMILFDFVPLSSSSEKLHALILLGLFLAPVSLPATLIITDRKNQAAIKRRQVHGDMKVLQ
jgi:hypothetical protein